MLYTCNASIWDAEAGKWRVQDPHELRGIVFKKEKKKERSLLAINV